MNEIIWLQTRFIIPEELLNKLRRTYEGFDHELGKMEMWYLANPTKRKKNHHRFIVNWLNKKKTLVTTFRTYNKENAELKVKIDKMREEATPPPTEWQILKERLKRG